MRSWDSQTPANTSHQPAPEGSRPAQPCANIDWLLPGSTSKMQHGIETSQTVATLLATSNASIWRDQQNAQSFQGTHLTFGNGMDISRGRQLDAFVAVTHLSGRNKHLRRLDSIKCPSRHRALKFRFFGSLVLTLRGGLIALVDALKSKAVAARCRGRTRGLHAATRGFLRSQQRRVSPSLRS